MTTPNNKTIYDEKWPAWRDQKVHGPASRWLRGLVCESLANAFSGRSPSSILDVGCGEGTITAAVAHLFPTAKVLGIDFSKVGIQLAQECYAGPLLEFRHLDGLPSTGEAFDLVIATEVLEHIEHWKSFLQEITGLAGGWILLTFPTGRMREFEVEVGHYRNYAHGQIEAEMAALGFNALDIRYAGFPFYSPFYRELCQLIRPSTNRRTTGKFGMGQQLASAVLYGLFKYASSRRQHGDQFCGLFARG